MSKPSMMCACEDIRSTDRCTCDRCGLFIAVVVERLREPQRAYAWGQEDGERAAFGRIVTWLLENGHRAAGLALIDANKGTAAEELPQPTRRGKKRARS